MSCVPPRRTSWPAPLLVLLAAGCATPSRRLPTRTVDDPITLPARMMEVRLRTGGTLHDHQDQRQTYFYPAIDYGLTDRLELVDLLNLQYALLDDAPAAWAATGGRSSAAPLGLAVLAGFEGIGYSTAEGLLLFPRVEVIARKRVSERVRLGLFTGAHAVITDRRHQVALNAGAGVVVQTTDRLALDLDVSEWFEPAGLRSTSSVSVHEVTLGPGLAYRPWHWLTLGLDVNLLWRFEPRMEIELTPDMPVPRPMKGAQPQLWGVLSTTFHW